MLNDQVPRLCKGPLGLRRISPGARRSACPTFRHPVGDRIVVNDGSIPMFDGEKCYI